MSCSRVDVRAVRRSVSYLAGANLARFVQTGAVSHPEKGLTVAIIKACDVLGFLDWHNQLDDRQYALLKDQVRKSYAHFMGHEEVNIETIM